MNKLIFIISLLFLISNLSCDNHIENKASDNTISNEEYLEEDTVSQEESSPSDEAEEEEQQEDEPAEEESEEGEEDLPNNDTFELPEIYTEKMEFTPDLLQINDYLPGSGKTYCGPVSVSNALMALALNGYPDLVPEGTSETESQLELARILGEYMDTGLVTGTVANDLLKGLRDFITSKNYLYSSITYQGTHSVDSEFYTGITHPELSFLKESVYGFSIVILQVGWYNYSTTFDCYIRISGHYVTLVGYGEDQNGNPDAGILIIHDPSPRSGPDKLSEYVKAVRINTGTLGLFESADGFYYLEGIQIPDGSDHGIIEGVVVVRM